MITSENHPSAYIKHQLPGRVRLKIPQKRGDFRYFDRIAELFTGCPGITQLQLNPPSASILICHAAKTDFLNIAEFAQTNGLFTIIEQPEEETFTIPYLPIPKLTSTGLNRVEESLMDFSQGRLDGRSLLFLALIGLAVRQMSRGHVLGAASSLLWYAFRILKEENEKMFNLDKYDDASS
jgi:Heavy metal associated domain 2